MARVIKKAYDDGRWVVAIIKVEFKCEDSSDMDNSIELADLMANVCEYTHADMARATVYVPAMYEGEVDETLEEETE